MIHLIFDLQELLEVGIKDHAVKVMDDLGIEYVHRTPQSMLDSWWFWNCKNLPEPLPSYLRIVDLNPIDCIGYGLSKEDAEKILNNK